MKVGLPRVDDKMFATPFWGFAARSNMGNQESQCLKSADCTKGTVDDVARRIATDDWSWIWGTGRRITCRACSSVLHPSSSWFYAAIVECCFFAFMYSFWHPVHSVCTVGGGVLRECSSRSSCCRMLRVTVASWPKAKEHGVRGHTSVLEYEYRT